MDEQTRGGRELEALELIAEELEKLRLLREHGMGARVEDEEGVLHVRPAGEGQAGTTTGPGTPKDTRPLRFPRRLRLCCFPGGGRGLTERGKRMGLLGGSGGKDKDEGSMDKAKGRMKEAGGSLTGDKKLKREGGSDQRKGKAKQKKGNLKDLLS